MLEEHLLLLLAEGDDNFCTKSRGGLLVYGLWSDLTG